MRRAASLGAGLALLAASGLGSAAEPRAGAGVPGFVLRDQYGREHGVAFPRARPCILILADRRGSDQLEPWIRPLYERYGDRVDLAGVAALGGVPRLARGLVRRIFRRKLDYPVLLDWQGAIWDELSCVPNATNLLVLSPDGVIVYRAHGAAGEEALAACIRRLDRLVADS